MKILRSKKDFVYISNVKHNYIIEDWDMGNGYELTLSLDEEVCKISIFNPEKHRFNYEVAEKLGIDFRREKIVRGVDPDPDGRELYVSAGICSESIEYTRPKDYMILLRRIEKILNDIHHGKRS